MADGNQATRETSDGPEEKLTTQFAGLKDQVPVLGYRNYWYPAIPAGKVGENPQHIKLLGDDVVLFRDLTSRTTYAMADSARIVMPLCQRAISFSLER